MLRGSFFIGLTVVYHLSPCLMSKRTRASWQGCGQVLPFVRCKGARYHCHAREWTYRCVTIGAFLENPHVRSRPYTTGCYKKSDPFAWVERATLYSWRAYFTDLFGFTGESRYSRHPFGRLQKSVVSGRQWTKVIFRRTVWWLVRFQYTGYIPVYWNLTSPDFHII